MRFPLLAFCLAFAGAARLFAAAEITPEGQHLTVVLDSTVNQHRPRRQLWISQRFRQRRQIGVPPDVAPRLI